MKYNNICCFSFVIFLNISISPFTFALWTADRPPKRPADPNVLMSCTNWILYQGFFNGNDNRNEELAMDRDVTLDVQAFLWTVGYAYSLNSIVASDSIVSASEFCVFLGVSGIGIPYLALEDATKTCTEWIHLYGFDLADVQLNWEKSKWRNYFADDHISHWVVSYARVLEELEQSDENLPSPSTFCNTVRANADKSTLFMKRHDMEMTCVDWIKLYGFTDDVELNYRSSSSEYDEMFVDQIHFWAKSYINFVFLHGYRVPITPLVYCTIIGVNESTTAKFFAYE